MKIIGKSGHGQYIATVSHDELEQLTNKYYGHLPQLEVGSVMDLGQGYDFRRDIGEVGRKMEEAYDAFVKASGTMQKFAAMVARLPRDGDGK